MIAGLDFHRVISNQRLDDFLRPFADILIAMEEGENRVSGNQPEISLRGPRDPKNLFSGIFIGDLLEQLLDTFVKLFVDSGSAISSSGVSRTKRLNLDCLQ